MTATDDLGDKSDMEMNEDELIDVFAQTEEENDAEIEELFGDGTGEPRPDRSGEIDISSNRNMNHIILDLIRSIGNNLYQSNGKLVDIQEFDGKYEVIDLSETEILNYLCRESRFYRSKTVKGIEQRSYVNMPTSLQMKHMMGSTRIIQRHVRELKGFAHAPTLLSDGTVLLSAGYHSGSGLYVVDNCDIHQPLSPTRADAKDAAALFLDRFMDYPFSQACDPYLFLTACLTGAARRALGVAPIPGVFINAHDRGAGKSALTEIITNVNFDGDAYRSGWPGQSEMEKRLIGWGLAKPECIVFDNIKGRIDGASVEDAITSAKYGGRVLGKSENVRGRFLSMLIVNANNGEMSEDMARRFLHVRLSTQKKEGHEFRHTDVTPPVYAAENSQELKTYLITILRAWMRHGQPDTSRRLASFEEWSDLVLGASEWVSPKEGARQFEMQKTREKQLRGYETEEDGDFLATFNELANGRWMGLVKIRKIANSSGLDLVEERPLAKAILDALPRSSSIAAGKTFARTMRTYSHKPFKLDDAETLYRVISSKQSGYAVYRIVELDKAEEEKMRDQGMHPEFLTSSQDIPF